ncbi:MAG: hypothetical protein ABIH18_00190 [Candidatus Omnitrophota bacterium]
MTDIQMGIILGVVTLLQGLSIFIIKTIIENKIKFEFRKREQAAMVASLFTEWSASEPDYKKLNQLAWEATLWLPDKIAKDVNMRLNNAKNAKNVKDILIQVKDVIQGCKSNLKANEIVHFPKQPLTQSTRPSPPPDGVGSGG